LTPQRAAMALGRWALSSTLRLGTIEQLDPSVVQREEDLGKYVQLLPKDKFPSVSSTFEQLAQDRTYDSDIYAIFSQRKGCYFLIYRVGQETKARALFGKLVGKHCKAMQIVKPITMPTEGGEPPKVELEKRDLDHLVETLRLAKATGAKEVAIVSIMGTFRQGKSFLLNLLAHYFEWLQAQQQDDNWQPRARDEDYRLDPQTESEGGQKVPDPEWIPDTVKEHFKVDGEQDAKACTVGVWLLSQPYLLRKPGSRERVAVLLMDSQGAFDGQLEAKQSRAILGITAVLASTVIYNVKPFAADAVQHLSDLTCISEDAVQNAAEGSEQVGKCCFGRMCILVRDKKISDEGTSYPCRLFETGGGRSAKIR